MRDPARKRPRYFLRSELADLRQQQRALLVRAPDDARTPAFRQVEQCVLYAHLNQSALFLDDEHLLEAVGEGAHCLRIERIGHADLEHADAEVRCLGLAQSHLGQRLQRIHRRLARRDDAVAPPRPVDDARVDRICPRERHGRGKFCTPEPRLLRYPGVAGPDVHAVRREVEIGCDQPDTLGVAIDRGCRIDRVGRQLEAHPRAGEARHTPAEDAEIQHLLHRRRIEDGHAQIREHRLGGRRHIGRLHCRVVTDGRQHTAKPCGAGQVRMPDRIDGAVEPRSLAVPNGGNPVVLAARIHGRLLRAPARRRRKILVDGGVEEDLVGLEFLRRAPQLLVDVVHRRTAIARDVGRRIVARRLVAPELVHGEADQRLAAGEIDDAGLQAVLVVEGNLSQHSQTPHGITRRMLSVPGGCLSFGD